MEEMLSEFLSKASAFLWGAPLLVLLVGTGIYLTVRLNFIQIFKLATGLRFAFGEKGRASDKEGDVSPFQALMTALAATIGTGNIVGVATAIAVGGPGALFGTRETRHPPAPPRHGGGSGLSARAD